MTEQSQTVLLAAVAQLLGLTIAFGMVAWERSPLCKGEMSMGCRARMLAD